MLTKLFSPIIHIMRRAGRFYGTCCSNTTINRVPKNSVSEPLVRHRDHDYEGVINGKN